MFLTAEQTNELLLKNHDLRPAGSKALLEAHANSKKINRPRKSNFGPYHDKEKKPKKVTNDSICHRCGMTRHWSRTCRMPKHFVDLYQASLKNTSKRGESHVIEINHAAITIVEYLTPEVVNINANGKHREKGRCLFA